MAKRKPKSILPRVATYAWSGDGVSDDYFDGRCYALEWLGFLVEVSVGRRTNGKA